ncbi:ABC transporter substrate-binding protein [Aquabacter cavernae]|uniref:ABC transporter substrate-binding protein n=1 Tax=Aquabacter cavernae TaxID=2496029 RepID=UPI00196A87CB|nr:ABC transporter substrate-binding protein [Aquabacter cavernae]
MTIRALFSSPRLAAAGLVLAGGLATPAAAQEVVIGVPAALTGQFAFAGVPNRNGMQIALEQVQASGELGPLKLKVLFEDTGSDKNQATTLITRFSEYDKAALILGPTSSVEAFAALPVAQKNGTPVISGASADVTPVGDWIFKATATPVTIMQALAQRALADLKPKKVAYVFNRDNDAYIAQKNGLRDAFVAAGVATVAEETIVGSDSDFTALATKLASLDIDTLVISTTAELSANIIIQAKQAGLSDKVRILGTPSMASAQFLKVGGAAVEGTIFVADYFLGGENALNKAFVEAYTKKYNTPPDVFAAIGYTQFYEAVTALKAAGATLDREAIRKGIFSIKDMPTILGDGKLTITEKRTPVYGGYVLTVKGGKLALL